ncbi:MAG: 2-dehydropantoate 2-reductase [Candidatus Omnitrophica bacterium]|nr:2-dehydropantoate 2-reductase [Candidatus Omnitrophota bacterium]
MKIAVVGSGAMGCLFAAFLSRSKAGHEVWVLAKDQARAKRLSSSGIEVEGDFNFKVKINATANAADMAGAALVIIAVKSYNTEAAVKSIMPILSQDSKVLTIQNGLGNLEMVNEFVGTERALGGVTSCGATVLKEGRIKHAGSDETIIGRPDGKIFADVRQIANLLNEAKIETKMSKDIKSVIWSKLIINAGINALAAITRLPNGRLIKQEPIKEMLRQAVSEAVKVAKRKGIKLIYDDPIQKVESVCVATSCNICSMLQDIMNKKPTEIDAINGAISRHAKGLSIKTPVNDMLYALVKTIESNYDKQC